MPIDATTTPSWRALADHTHELDLDLRQWFAQDPDRARRFTFHVGDLHIDLSKNLITDQTLTLLTTLAEQVEVLPRFAAMLAGERINVTENRSVLHTALRRPRTTRTPLVVDGKDIDLDVRAELDKVYAFAQRVRSGAWTGVTGQRIRTVVNIGIGGSDLGPVMVYEALQPYVHPELRCRFISNIDPSDLADTLADLDPATTLFIVASKTFTTVETVTNAKLARTWLWDGLIHEGHIANSDETRQDAVAKHFVAVSTALDKVAEFGIDPVNAFGFWDWVGGRYSVDSAIGTSLVVAVGPEAFAQLLAGFHTIDNHMATAPLEANVPVLMGMLNIWYTNFLGAHTHAVLPYDQHLHRFPAYLQQLTMESNGKSVRWDGSPVTSDTGEVFWGEPGTNGQHAFYQLIHQGTRLIPADFIAMANPAHPLREGQTDVHGLFLSNFFAQTKALAFGRTAAEVRQDGTAEDVVPARVFSGNRPTTSILAPRLTPTVVGQLIALYEHITFVQGVVWGIDSFDQWGVELGKKLALEIAPAVNGDVDALATQDPSTQSLIAAYHRWRPQAATTASSDDAASST